MERGLDPAAAAPGLRRVERRPGDTLRKVLLPSCFPLFQNTQLQLRPKPRQTLDHALHRSHEAHSHGVHQHAAEEAAADAAVRGRQRGEGRFHPSGPTHPSTAALVLRLLTPASLLCSYTTCWWTRANWTTHTSSTRLTTATTSGSSA